MYIIYHLFFIFLSWEINCIFSSSKYVSGIGRSTELVLERGQGGRVWTTEGVEYLDFTTGIGVCLCYC